MKSIDLNCDMGEMPEAVADGSQEALMQYVSSVNVACGGYAGDAATMRETVQQALRHGVSVGAHPGYEDRADFGRKELQLAPEKIAELVHRQVLALAEIAEQCGAKIAHVKAHGALYNQAARNRQIARAIAEGVGRWKPDAILVGLAGSVMLEEFRSAEFSVAAEAFADRRYEPDGSLRSRKLADALLRDPEEAAEQALRIVNQSSVLASDGSVVPVVAQTICIHSDTPGAIEIAAAVNRRLQQAAIHIARLHSKS
ncbi:MAG: 5-oxoprolinase subunit PxpA [Candidatus Acidiferrum sp.]